MWREDVLKLLAEQRAQFDRFGVKSLAIFGSVVRGDSGPESDVDVLAEFQGQATFDQFMDSLC